MRRGACLRKLARALGALCALLACGCVGEGSWRRAGLDGAVPLMFGDALADRAVASLDARLDVGVDAAPRGDAARDAARLCDAAGCEDQDGDELAAAHDCDDRDPAIGGSATRSCASACGSGLERCAAGRWSPCDAPTVCDCIAGTPERRVGCGACGKQLQRCVSGKWVEIGSCEGQGVCTAGELSAVGCDGCAQRLCDASCQWGACALRPGNECEYQGGANFRCCGPRMFQFCLPTCRWSTDCEWCSYCPC